MIKTIYFLTSNKNKFEEAKLILPNIKQLNIDLPEIQELDAKKIIKEKIKAAYQHKKANFIIEDTSLYLKNLNGLPGPLIKWFIESIGPEGIFKMAKSFNCFEAEAITIVAYATSKNKIHFFEGKISGTIVKPKILSSLRWDSIFKPSGYQKTFAEMSRKEKTAISMRGAAFAKLREYLYSELNSL